ncbi:OmpA family protein [Aquincola sp. MAHUQ-54]|uniref:OmpA family protein n=1 Tax=Aquincola agrisoli TaxID=3119538 RepID=A0AAW9Q263_9BURK
MKRSPTVLQLGRAVAAAAGLATLLHAHAADALDVGDQVPEASAVKEGLFPEDACKELEAAGFKCMGFKPAVRYSLPAASFKVGSADLPEVLRRQLDVFAEVLRGRRDTGRAVRIEGHADASGTPEANQALSQRRADAVKRYLVDKGADGGMLEAVGLGATSPKVGNDPFAAANRRVEIGRAKP